MRAARPALSMYVTSERSITMRSGFFSIMAVSDAVTTGETCRSISPLSGNTLGRSPCGFGADGDAFSFFIQPFNRQWITIRAYGLLFPHLKGHRLKNPGDILKVDLDSMCLLPRRPCAHPRSCRKQYRAVYLQSHRSPMLRTRGHAFLS